MRAETITMTNSDMIQLPYPVILASGSPRRKELLGSLGLEFKVIPSDVDEGAFDIDHLPPGKRVEFLAEKKAAAVADKNPDSLVIGSDTIVVLDDVVYEKPVDKDDAFRMLKILQGNTHQVFSAITLVYPDGKIQNEYLSTRVTFRSMTDEEIRAYIETGEPMDKAGAYAIQGLGSLNIEKIDGCYFNVVGMSLYLLGSMLNKTSPS